MSLTRRNLLGLGTAATVAALTSSRLFAGSSSTPLYKNNIIIDGLGFPGGLSRDEGSGLIPGEITDIGNSGLTATHLTVGSVGTMAPLLAFEKIVRDIAKWEKDIELNPHVLSSVRQASDIQSSKNNATTGLIYGLQDGVSFEDDLDRLSALQQIGIRVIQPTYNRRNLLGDGCMEPSDAGLSRIGTEAIERLNNLGILVDLSHCGRRTAADAIANSSQPVSFTHTGCYALAEHPRHRTDEEIKAVADGGGVVGIYIMPYLARGKQPTAADVIAHLEHAIQIAGEDHVCIGTDGSISPTTLSPEYTEHFREMTKKRKNLGIAAPFETETGYLFANDLNTPRRFETLAATLLERGHSESRVRKILGGNLTRLFNATWSVPASS
ncbi:MAG: peptidase M19 [Xanthomonadales bacterium]|nr:peptidase M19 [Xanthomonadales bacterium]